MSGSEADGRPSCTWVTITDDAGGTRLEARWAPLGGGVHRDAA